MTIIIPMAGLSSRFTKAGYITQVYAVRKREKFI